MKSIDYIDYDAVTITQEEFIDSNGFITFDGDITFLTEERLAKLLGISEKTLMGISEDWGVVMRPGLFDPESGVIHSRFIGNPHRQAFLQQLIPKHNYEESLYRTITVIDNSGGWALRIYDTQVCISLMEYYYKNSHLGVGIFSKV